MLLIIGLTSAVKVFKYAIISVTYLNHPTFNYEDDCRIDSAFIISATKI